jgi:hypothetical protein
MDMRWDGGTLMDIQDKRERSRFDYAGEQAAGCLHNSGRTYHANQGEGGRRRLISYVIGTKPNRSSTDRCGRLAVKRKEFGAGEHRGQRLVGAHPISGRDETKID